MKSKIAVAVSLLAVGLWLSPSEVGTAEAQIAFRAASSTGAASTGPTRFYLESTAADVDPASERGAWDLVSYTARRLSRTKTGAITSRGVAEAVATADYDILVLKLVSEPITTAQTISGTLNWVLGARETNAALNAHWHVHVYVLRGSDTLVGTLYADYTEPLGTNEWSATAQGWGPTGAITLTPVAIQADDRIVIEAGFVARNTTATSYTGRLWYGGTGADLTVAGDETTQVGWFEFSQDLFPSLTIATPAGTVQDDVMVASIGFRANCCAMGTSAGIGITPPTGWTEVRRLDNANDTSNGLVVYQKVAGASEGSHQWTFSCTGTCAPVGFQSAAGGIVSFSGVDTSSPIDGGGTVEAGQNTAALAQTTPSGLSTTVANTMLVASYSYASAGPWAPTPGGPLGAMNEAVDVLAGNQSTAINYILKAAAGAIGQYQATPTPDDDAGNAHILALRPGCPAVADSTYVAVNARSAQATVYWSSANPVLILTKTAAWAGEKPSSFQEYNVNDAIGATTVVFKGTGSETSFNQGSLTNGTTYRYKVFAKTGSGATACYSAGTEVTALHPSAAGSPQVWSYGLVGGSMLKPGIAGNTALYASGNGGRVVSLDTGTGTQSWAPVATNAAVQGWLSWLPLSSYRYRQRITITAGSAAVPNGYSASVTFNHASLVSAGKSQADGDDIRVFYKNGSSWVELDRVLDRLSSWNNAATTIWFKTQAAIGASSSDSNYYLQYGNPSAANPPVNKSNVYDFFDDFSGTLAAWSEHVQGGFAGWAISGGALTVSSGVIDGDVLYVTGKNYTDVVIEADFRSTTSVADDIAAPVWRLDTATGARYDFSHSTGSLTRQRYWTDWGTRIDQLQEPAVPSAGVWYHAKVTVNGSTFTAEWDGGPTTVWSNAGLASGTVGVAAEYIQADFDNFQVRLYVNPEPTTSQAAEEEDAGSATSWLDSTVFGGDQSARVFRVNTATGVKSWEVTMTGADAVQAAVSVQVRAWSNSAFQAAYTDDVIFATTLNTTNTNCGTPTTNNKVFALRASDGQVLWTFNGSCTSLMDIISGQPWVDYTLNRLYVASRDGGGGQPSLWVIRTVAEGPNPAGSLVASFALGHINGSPTRSYDANTLYVGTEAGRLYALDLAQDPPVLKWGGSTYANVLGEIKGFVWEDWTTSGRLYFTTNAAALNVWCLQDPGVGGTFSDPAPPCSSWTRATVSGAATPLLLDKLYVGGGASDGKLHEINLTNGGQDAECTVGDGTKAVGDASSETAGEVFVGTTEKIYRFNAPFPVACP